ncbi:MAG: winged helix-turn-helix transcriptional regulator [Promethearchaeota archaeon]|nr:MAG: winged helix-turn-helix transcriptional regulator [Candidatus Lokiarchaeota archaeon]
MKRTKNLIVCLIFFISIGSISLLPIKPVNGQWGPNYSYYQQVYINPNQFYNFTIPPYPDLSLFEFDLISDVSIDLTLGINGALLLSTRQIYLQINNTEPIQFNITAELDFESFLEDLPEEFNLSEIIAAFQYNCLYHIQTNSTVSQIEVYFRNRQQFGFDPSMNYSLGIYKNISGQWSETGIELMEVDKDGNSYLKASLSDVEGESDYYLTPYSSSSSSQPSEPLSFDWLIVLIPGIIIVAILSVTIAKKDYVRYLKRRIVSIDKGAHRLTMEEVLENENRSKIIDIILKKPGIHFNELKRNSGLASGNLVWHLDILETYKVIKKKRVKNYVIYIPYYSKNPLSNVDLKLQKSELTLEILEKIEENPGIWNGKITEELEIHRKTIQYHIDKLIDLGLINRERDGIKKRIYPNLAAEYFKDNIEKDESSGKDK